MLISLIYLQLSLFITLLNFTLLHNLNHTIKSSFCNIYKRYLHKKITTFIKIICNSKYQLKFRKVLKEYGLSIKIRRLIWKSVTPIKIYFCHWCRFDSTLIFSPVSFTSTLLKLDWVRIHDTNTLIVKNFFFCRS